MIRSVAKVELLWALLAATAACLVTTTEPSGQGGSTTSPPPVIPCDPQCGANAICTPNGTCECTSGYTVCPGSDGGMGCTGILSDSLNCGVCDHACPTGQECVLGECSCKPSLTIAQCEIDGGIVCVDLSKNPNAGGGCGIMTPRGCWDCEPDAGVSGLICCGGSCIPTDDPFNCGGCGNVCISGSCILGDAGLGICNCPLPYSVCPKPDGGSTCADPYTDFDHCGASCAACASPATQCLQGHCR